MHFHNANSRIGWATPAVTPDHQASEAFMNGPVSARHNDGHLFVSATWPDSMATPGGSGSRGAAQNVEGRGGEDGGGGGRKRRVFPSLSIGAAAP